MKYVSNYSEDFVKKNKKNKAIMMNIGAVYVVLSALHLRLLGSNRTGGTQVIILIFYT